MRALFEEPTVAGLARRIEAARRTGGGGAPPPVVPVPRQKEVGLPSVLRPGAPLVPRPAPAGPCDLQHAARLAHPGAALRRPQLTAVLAELVRRHEALRTHLPGARRSPRPGGSDRPLCPSCPILPILDLSALDPEAAQAAEAEAPDRRGGFACPFDLATGPLLPAARSCCSTRSEEQTSSLFDVHHIVERTLWSDGRAGPPRWRPSIRPSPRGGRPRCRALPVQYADFAVWQRRCLQGRGPRIRSFASGALGPGRGTGRGWTCRRTDRAPRSPVAGAGFAARGLRAGSGRRGAGGDRPPLRRHPRS